jgi:hypothetical protein
MGQDVSLLRPMALPFWTIDARVEHQDSRSGSVRTTQHRTTPVDADLWLYAGAFDTATVGALQLHLNGGSLWPVEHATQVTVGDRLFGVSAQALGSQQRLHFQLPPEFDAVCASARGATMSDRMTVSSAVAGTVLLDRIRKRTRDQGKLDSSVNIRIVHSQLSLALLPVYVVSYGPHLHLDANAADLVFDGGSCLFQV